MATTSTNIRNLFHINAKHAFHIRNWQLGHSLSCSPAITTQEGNIIIQLRQTSPLSSKRNPTAVFKATPGNDSVSPANDDNDVDDGVSLGTMKLPLNTDLERFETLLFQWANSLCQGANLPLPMPLKVDKIPGGARLGFITVGDGETQVLVHIDCSVFPSADGSGPVFRAIRNGPLKAEAPPGEPRIMRSLLAALKKCVEIARV